MNDFIPNFTQIPNVVLDNIMSELSNQELRVLLYICRRTYGFHKEKDMISISQFISGIENKSSGCGLSKQGVLNGINGLIDKKIISRVQDSYINTYYINTDYVNSKQSTSLTSSSQRSVPEVVNLVDTQKKEKEIEIKIYSHKDYLIKIPDTDLTELTQKYNCDKAQVLAKGDQMYHWVESNGKKYKNFRSLLMNALSRDYGLRQKANNAMMI